MEENLKIYNLLSSTPNEARKEIGAGRLKGMTDINPMWRIKKLTEVFGICGFGWKYTITSQRLEHGCNGQISAFVDIDLFVKVDGEWSDAIQGTGGASFVTQESKGLYQSDECFKMALTDAIGIACKALGMSADIYFAKGYTKYTAPKNEDIPQTLPVETVKAKYKVPLQRVKTIDELNALYKGVPANEKEIVKSLFSLRKKELL